MQIITLTDKKNVIEQNTYLLLKDNEGILIDAGASLKEIKKYNVKIIAILLTHSHFDHILYLEEIQKYYNCPIFISEEDKQGLFNTRLNLSILWKSFKFNGDLSLIKTFKDNDILNLHEFSIKCLLTPGHTLGSSCFLIEENLFSGDTLFADSIGRADFPNSSPIKQKSSLERLDKLNYNILYPGHGRTSTKQEQKANIEFWLNQLN